MQVMMMAAEFSQVSAQLPDLWEGIYNIMPSDI